MVIPTLSADTEQLHASKALSRSRPWSMQPPNE
jgi:hypothetical protein